VHAAHSGHFSGFNQLAVTCAAAAEKKMDQVTPPRENMQWQQTDRWKNWQSTL
jgi:hypothetical protein